MNEPIFQPLTDLPAFPLWEQYVGLWAIDEGTMSALWSRVNSLDLRAHMAQAVQKTEATVRREQRFGMVEIRGTMTKQGSSLSDAGSTVRIRQAIRQLAGDQSIDGIMIVVDSGGGTVAGTAELHAAVRDAAKQKPVLAFVEDMAASAAYYAISAASKIVANTSHAMVGSIGTLFVMYDYSGMAEKDGVRPVVVRTGEMKGAGIPGTKITAEQERMFQELADNTQKSFSAAVKSGRGLSAEQMKEVETARVFTASAAKGLNLIDDVMSFDAAVKELGRMAKEKGKPKMSDLSQGLAGGLAATLETRAATVAELEAACQGADSGFIVSQARAGATLQAALTAFTGIQSLEIKDLKAKLTASEKATADAQSQLELARKSTGNHAPLREKPAGQQVANGDTAKAQSEDMIQKAMASGLDRGRAHAKVMRENPELRQRLIDEANNQ